MAMGVLIITLQGPKVQGIGKFNTTQIIQDAFGDNYQVAPLRDDCS